MAASARELPAEAAATRWLVSGHPHGDGAVPVRDYFLRLGIPATIVSPTEIELETTAGKVELEEYVQSWTSANGPRLVLREVGPPAPPSARLDGTLFRPPLLGEILQRRGLVSGEEVESALARAKETGRLLGVVLIEGGVLFEEDLARTLAAQLELPYISIGRVGVDHGVARLLPSSLGRELAAIPVRMKGDRVLVAFADPTNPDTVAAVRRYVPRLEIGVAELSHILSYWRTVERAAGGESAARDA